MKIRTWDMKDLPRLIELGKAMHAESPGYRHIPFDENTLKHLAKTAIKNPHTITAFVAETDNLPDIIGMIIVTIQPYFFSKAVFLTDLLLYVDQDHRNNLLVPSALLDRAMEWGRQRDVLEFRFGETTGVMPEALDKFYRFKGFEKGGTLYVRPA